MNDINAVLEIDWVLFIKNLFLIIFAFVATGTIIIKSWDILKNPIEWFKNRNKDHELLEKTIDTVKKLEICVEDGLELIKENRENINKFYDHRDHDRKQSLQIQAELVNSNVKRDEQILNLMIANKELLADRINQKYKHYISLGGIPEDEFEEFVSMHKAYNGVGGNSHGDAKFEYCIDHLPIIPVEIKLAVTHK